jgi:hypothetical protein
MSASEPRLVLGEMNLRARAAKIGYVVEERGIFAWVENGTERMTGRCFRRVQA